MPIYRCVVCSIEDNRRRSKGNEPLCCGCVMEYLRPSPLRRGSRAVHRNLIHFIAECTVCDWWSEDYIHGQQLASRHATRTGHLVKAEAGYSIKYVKENADV